MLNKDVQRLVQLAINDKELSISMHAYAIEQLRLSGKFTAGEIETCLQEDNENSDVALFYWDYTSQYFRKLMTATAATFTGTLNS